jgi:MYXO-CTERM domain-containing protein
MLWRATLPLESSTTEYSVCATDLAGNEKCEARPMIAADAGVDAPTTTPPGDDDGGCCSSTRDASGSLLLALLTLVGIRRRRSR